METPQTGQWRIEGRGGELNGLSDKKDEAQPRAVPRATN
jgi:hypothetical protein